MKYIIVMMSVFLMLPMLSNCNSTTKSQNKKTEIETTPQNDIPGGKALIAKSDCMACHKENKKLVGPSFIDIAKKYKADEKNIEYLSSKILQGGKGVWGQIAMNAHPNLSKKDADEIVTYILSFKE
jgi:cytochrome c